MQAHLAVCACARSTTRQINSNVSYDFDLNTRPSTSSSPSQKPIVGGLSYLFSSPCTLRSSASSSFGEELGPFRHDKGDGLKELSCSFGYSSSSKSVRSFKMDHHQTPVSILQGPVYCSSSSDPNGSLNQDLGKFYCGGRDGGAIIDMDELTFNLEGTFNKMDTASALYIEELLLGARLRHDIFYDDFVVQVFYEAEKAHRGQMHVNGNPYLQHCVETAVSLALIGANSTVAAAGLLHEILRQFLCELHSFSQDFWS